MQMPVRRKKRCKIAEATEILGESARTIRNQATAGKIQGSAKIFGTWTFDIALLHAFVAEVEGVLMNIDLDRIRAWDGGEGEFLDQQAVENTVVLLRRARVLTDEARQSAADDWREDPGADARWNAGLDFAMVRFCQYLGVDPSNVHWDAATETLDGDVSAVIGNILRAKFGEDWAP
ncbi:hypothetical protein [Bradyrhizobium genosp. A]|uniref:hypothetical protein n=1 Tax=Bradyrhizobium genosp. A TaxID=83626 RepID=UPI003CED62CE